jgi:hypothetical protein
MAQHYFLPFFLWQQQLKKSEHRSKVFISSHIVSCLIMGNGLSLAPRLAFERHVDDHDDDMQYEAMKSTFHKHFDGQGIYGV